MTPHMGGRVLDGGRVSFRVWAPKATSVELHIVAPYDKVVQMDAGDRGYWQTTVPGAGADLRYLYRLDGDLERPDPASQHQPDGVHGPSGLVDHEAFGWEDARWFNLPLTDYVIYELHTGAFTPEGTFDAVIPHLDELSNLGVNAIELMPVAQFPGARNWGYDGVYPYAVQHSYGGPDALKRLVNACHRRGLAVILDVVYNHLGPEGCYVEDFGPYFTDHYRTPWGKAMNFDQPHSDEVRAFFIGNALFWFEHYHVDALRLDAVHAILDTSALPFLEELSVATQELSDRLNRRLHLIAESDDNDARLVTPRVQGGYGLDAQWNDDFHHALHSLVTGERSGYYADYGTLRHLARAYGEGYVYQGEYSSHRQRRHGRSSKHRPAERFVVFARNHDQIGNRMLGDRLATNISFEAQKLVAGAILLSPYIPLLFMGEEYGETAPFQYFTDHSDPEIVKAVRTGRREEFGGFGWEGEPPDPQDLETFNRSTIDRSKRTDGHHRVLWDLYRSMLALRRSHPALRRIDNDDLNVSYDERAGWIVLHRWFRSSEAMVILNMGEETRSVPLPVTEGHWDRALDTASSQWDGPGSATPDRLDADLVHAVDPAPQSIVVYVREED